MRIIGTVDHYADRTASLPMLTNLGVVRPEIMMNALDIWSKRETAFGSFLGQSGLTFKDLTKDVGTFRVMGNRQVKWMLNGHSFRKGAILEQVSGGTPGIGNAEFTVIVDTDYFGINDDLWLSDNLTTLHVMDKRPVGHRKFAYDVKLNTNSSTTYADPTLLAPGSEIGLLHTSYPEASEDATERYTQGEWHTNFCGIQRAKVTITGSAAHTRIMLEHNGQKLWDTRANLEMMKRWGMQIEHQLLFARSTMDENGRCYVQDRLGRDIVMGDGVLAQGDRGLKYSYNQLTSRMLENLLRDLQNMQTSSGNLRVALVCGMEFFLDFQRLMTDVFRESPQVFYVGGDGSKGSGVKTNFRFFQLGDMELFVFHSQTLDGPYHPNEYDQFGRPRLSGSAYAVSLGNTVGGDPNIIPFTIGNENGDRRFVRRVVNGMAGAGAKAGSDLLASSPVDARQDHILSEIGVIVQNPYCIAEVRKSRRP